MPKTISLRCVIAIVLSLGFVPGALLGAKYGFICGAVTWLAISALGYSIIMALDKLVKSRQPQESEGA